MRLLDLLRVGVVFERAQGDYLYHRRDGEEVGVLDLVGGYGSLLFGHHHPVLVAEAQRLLAEGPADSLAGLAARAGRPAGARAVAPRRAATIASSLPTPAPRRSRRR